MTIKAVETARITAIKLRFKLEAKRKVASSALKDIEDEIAAVDAALLEDLKASGEERVDIKGGMGIKVVSSIVPTVKDWDAFYAWIKKNNAFYMLERRPSVTGYRDILAAKKSIPGVESFNKTKIGLASAK